MDIHSSTPYKIVVITGATSGIGLAAAKGVASEGHLVIGVARSKEKAQTAKQSITTIFPQAKLEYHIADLSSQSEVRGLAKSILSSLKNMEKEHIDVLINNAGAVTSWLTLTEDGYELQFAVNHLAPFLLTNLLLPWINRSPTGRILTVSSGSHYRTRIHWKDVMLRRRYNTLRAYKQSKLANVLFTYELNRKLGQDSTTKAYAIDPGLVNTKIGTKGTSGLVNWFWNKRRQKGVLPEIAAESIIHLACRKYVPESESWYWKGCLPIQPSRYAQREEEAQRLWELSNRLCGLGSTPEN
jgi:NAD(P)-dependent dehydrogenase (short-subunit alcohol dehydrogenase family)